MAPRGGRAVRVRWRALLLAAVLAAGLAGIGSPGTAVGVEVAGAVAPTSATAGPIKPGFSKIVDAAAVLQPDLAVGSGRHTVFVQLAVQSAAAVSAAVLGGNGNESAARRAVLVQRSAIAALSSRISAAATAVDPGAVTVFRVGNAVAGVGLTADAAALRALAARRDVVRVWQIVPKTPANAGAAQLTRVLQTWTDTGVTGRGVRVGVIDTGIDYTHADFGGPGTPAAYQAAVSADAGPWQPTAKVVGGYDFVGDDYDAAPDLPAGGTGGANPAYQPVPHPDPNPLDCNGHGTHVAGTIAGEGVDAGGHTFTGNYGALSGPALYGMDVGPGMAPGASLYALKVFGCSGATDAVIPALDWALDPNGDGDFSDRLDVVDLSLTSPADAGDDPETMVLDALAGFGVLPVVAAGNGGDQTDAASSLAASVRSLAVASSVDSYQQLDGVAATLPGQPSQIVAGQVSVAFPWARSPDVSGVVVSLSPGDADGCTPLSAVDTAAVAGKVAWLSWDDDDSTRRCGSAARSANVRAAGGIGALLTSDTPVFTAAVTGDPGLPVLQLTAAATAALQPGVDHGLLVRFSKNLIGKKPEVDPSIADLISSWSARGQRGPVGVVKPDVTAPGDTVSSAAMGTGTGSSVRSGTSMAAAVVAGVAALVRQARPAFSPEQLKAAVMNTADADVHSGTGSGGDVLGPNRVGSGRVDARSAVAVQVLAYSSTTPGAVSVSFGTVPADVRQQSVVATSAVVVQNAGSDTADLAVTYQPVVGQPGVTYSVAPATMTLTAGSSALATVTMTITPSALRHTLDPGTPAQQANPLTGLDEARQYVASAAGRILITAPGMTPDRVPVYGAAKPVSSTTAADGTLGPQAGPAAGSPAVVLGGSGFALSAPSDPASTAYTSLVSVLDLGYRSTRVPSCAAGPGAGRAGTAGTAGTVVSTISPSPSPASAPSPTSPGGTTADVPAAACSAGGGLSADLAAVGAGRAVPAGSGAGFLWFGLATYDDWTTTGRNSFPSVNIDTDGDNTADFTVQVQAVGGDSDLLYALLFDDRGAGSLVGIYPVNFNLGNVDTNVFDTNVLLIPIDPSAIGYRTSMSSFPIRYSVATYSAYGAPQNSGTVDTTPAITFDVARPAISTASPLWQDQGGVGIPYRLAPGLSSADALVLHLHGADGAREQILTLTGGGG